MTTQQKRIPNYIKYEVPEYKGKGFTYNMWKFFKEKEWWEAYETKWQQKLHHWFVDWFYTLTQKKGFGWIDLFVNTLCVLEMNFKLYKNSEFKDEVNVSDMIYETEIPQGTLYCSGCKFKGCSKIAKFFYGEQMHGFCYYLNRGDFTYGHYTDLLWDGCKLCGINEEMEDEDLDYTDYTTE